jgi:hypothetical protein
MYLKEPSVENPIGKQTTSYRDYAKVFIEDIKGLFFMNLNDYPSTLNSDDFHMDKIILRFDDIEDFYLGVEYDEEIIVDKEFGDTNTNLSTGDSEFLKIAFDVRLGDNDIGYLSAINNSYSTNSYWQPYYNIFNNLRTCYNTSNTWSTQRECNRDALDDMEDFIYYNRSGFLFSLNNYIDRLIDIF